MNSKFWSLIAAKQVTQIAQNIELSFDKNIQTIVGEKEEEFYYSYYH